MNVHAEPVCLRGSRPASPRLRPCSSALHPATTQALTGPAVILRAGQPRTELGKLLAVSLRRAHRAGVYVGHGGGTALPPERREHVAARALRAWRAGCRLWRGEREDGGEEGCARGRCEAQVRAWGVDDALERGIK
jgi:hypothetical protein